MDDRSFGLAQALPTGAYDELVARDMCEASHRASRATHPEIPEEWEFMLGPVLMEEGVPMQFFAWWAPVSSQP